MKHTFKITGMTCAACAARLEKALGGLDGVSRCSVNLAACRAAIEYDAKRAKLGEVRLAICRAGFGWEELGNGVAPQSGQALGADGATPPTVQAVPSADGSTPQPLGGEHPGAVGNAGKKWLQSYWTKFMVAAAFALPLLYIAMGHMLPPGWHPPLPQVLHQGHSPLGFALAQMVLALPIVAVGRGFYSKGFGAVLRLSPSMDSLVAIGTSAALLYSIYNTWRIALGDGQAAESLHFETACTIIAIVLLGRALEAASTDRARQAIKKLIELAPGTATLLRGDQEVEVPIDDVKVGDVLTIRPGAKVPADGTVLEGEASIDESMLTGESMPVGKGPGDSVCAACINLAGAFRMRVEKTKGDTALARIIQLVEDAQCGKAPIARAADVVSGKFVPFVCAAALLTGLVWLLAGSGLGFALSAFIAVLVVACPCALGLATPTAIMVATGRAASRGILFKSGEALETAHRVSMVALDKTGTLTTGRPTVTNVLALDGDAKSLLLLAASAESGSEHPAGRAVVEEARARGLKVPKASDFRSMAGRGVAARVGGRVVSVGSRRLMGEMGVGIAPLEVDSFNLAREGKTPMFVGVDGGPAGLVAVADQPRPTSAAAVAALRRMGVGVAMVTGDSAQTAEAIARQVGINRVVSDALPQDKATEIKKLQAAGHCVAMVGDGINDAPALVLADVGMAIGSGTDIAMESADIVLMRHDPTDVAEALAIGRKTIRVIKQNLFLAFAYNVAAIPLAAGALRPFGGPTMAPIAAAAAMSLSSICVVLNALRLKRVAGGGPRVAS